MTIWNTHWERRESITSRAAQWDVEKILMVGHKGEKTEKEHFHAIVQFEKPIQQQSMNVRIKVMFGVKGAQYSTKVWDGRYGVGAGSYLFHDPEHVILFQHAFTGEEIADFMKANETVREIVEEKKTKASGRCVDRVLKEIADGGGQPWTRKRILKRLMDDIKAGDMYEPGDFVLKKYAEEIYMKQITTQKAWEEYTLRRIDRLIWCNQTQEAEVELFVDDT